MFNSFVAWNEIRKNGGAIDIQEEAEWEGWLLGDIEHGENCLVDEMSTCRLSLTFSIDPLNSDNNDDFSSQITLELAGTKAEHIPRCYAMNMCKAMNMFKDFVPMPVFSCTTQGKISVEGKNTSQVSHEAP